MKKGRKKKRQRKREKERGHEGKYEERKEGKEQRVKDAKATDMGRKIGRSKVRTEEKIGSGRRNKGDY